MHSDYANDNIYTEKVIDEMEIWFNHTLEDNASYVMKKYEVYDLLYFIKTLKSNIQNLKEKFENGKTDS